MTTVQNSAAQSATSRWARPIVFGVIMGSQLMMVLDTSIVTTALPHIEQELGFSTASLSWVHNAYALAFGGLLLLGARAGDLFGRVRVFMAGVLIFTVASFMAGVAPDALTLVIARLLQGAASALAIPATLALLVQAFPAPEERSRAISIYSAVIGAGGSVGIIVGGLFTDLLSWRWGLLINIPIGILVLVLAPRFLPKSDKVVGRFDILGALTITAGMTALVYGLVTAASHGWDTPVTVGSLIVAAVLIPTFVQIERRAYQPIVPLRLFGSSIRSMAYIARILIVGAMFSTFFFLSQYLQHVLGFSALLAGLSYIPLTLLFFAMVYVVRPLSDRLGKPRLLLMSLIVAAIGMLWLSRIGEGTNYFPSVLLPLLVLGVGQGIAIILLTEFGMSGIHDNDRGAASGLVNTAHQLGGSVGLALLTVVFGAANAQSAEGYSSVFTVATAFYVLAVPAVGVVLVAQRQGST